jgi:RNA-binding protein
MSKKDQKQLRSIGHGLKPVVTVAGNGLNENVMLELDRALNDHELIKVKLAVGDKSARETVTAELCDKCGAKLIQAIGNIILILRKNPKPDPKLSNLIKA